MSLVCARFNAVFSTRTTGGRRRKSKVLTHNLFDCPRAPQQATSRKFSHAPWPLRLRRNRITNQSDASRSHPATSPLPPAGVPVTLLACTHKSTSRVRFRANRTLSRHGPRTESDPNTTLATNRISPAPCHAAFKQSAPSNGGL